ncbi:MAG: GNAT family N-acetyltransferase [Thermoleophilia bacterium]|nr:GNAT family N-acetyltransferase [Thermoleophilia bacterium]
MNIRNAGPGDAPGLAELLGELGYPADIQRVARRLERLLADPASRLLVAAENGALLGFAGLHVLPLVEHDELGCVLTAIVVAERARRLGVGRRLAVAVEQEARARGCNRVVLGSAERRADAHAFYEALGYRYTGRRYAKQLG